MKAKKLSKPAHTILPPWMDVRLTEKEFRALATKIQNGLASRDEKSLYRKVFLGA